MLFANNILVKDECIPMLNIIQLVMVYRLFLQVKMAAEIVYIIVGLLAINMALISHGDSMYGVDALADFLGIRGLYEIEDELVQAEIPRQRRSS
jgi:hypothetical protein